jgi:hypothetical protein
MDYTVTWGGNIMKKRFNAKELILVLSIVLGLNLFIAGTGFAKDNTRGHDQEHGQVQGKGEAKDNKKQDNDNAMKPGNTDPKNQDKPTTTSTVYEHRDHKPVKVEKEVPRGLLIAYLKNQGKDAQSVIGDLLLNKYSITEIVYSLNASLGKGKLNVSVTKGTYGTTITVVGSDTSDTTVTGATYSLSTEDIANYAKELRNQLNQAAETRKDKADALAQLSDLYGTIGQNDDAVDVQKEAVKANPLDLEAYKKLGHLKKDKDIKSFVNGESVNFGSVLPVIKNNWTLVPFRAISDSLKAEVTWDPTEQSMTVTKNGVVVKLVIGSTTALVDGKEITLDAPAEIINGRTLIPVRFIATAFNADVQWEPESQSVVVNEL